MTVDYIYFTEYRLQILDFPWLKTQLDLPSKKLPGFCTKWLGSHVCFFTFPLFPQFFRPCFCYCFFLPPVFILYFPVFLLVPVTFIIVYLPPFPLSAHSLQSLLAPSSLAFHLAHLLSILSLLVVFIPFSSLPAVLPFPPSSLPTSPLSRSTSDSWAHTVSLYLSDKVTGGHRERRELQLHTELYVYDVTALKRGCLCSDRLLSAVVDGTTVKVTPADGKALQRGTQSYFACPLPLWGSNIYIWGCIKSRGSHISSGQTHPWQPGKGGSRFSHIAPGWILNHPRLLTAFPPSFVFCPFVFFFLSKLSLTPPSFLPLKGAAGGGLGGWQAAWCYTTGPCGFALFSRCTDVIGHPYPPKWLIPLPFSKAEFKKNKSLAV